MINSQFDIGKHVLDRSVRNMLSSAGITLFEIDLTNLFFTWSVDKTFHFYDFTKSFDGSIEGYKQLIHSDDKEVFDQFLIQSQSNINSTSQHRALWTDGTYHWLELIGRLNLEEENNKIIGTVQDISERKKIELEKEDWKTRYELVSESAGIIVYDYNISSGEILWSGNMEEILSFSSDEMGDINKWESLIHPHDRKEAFRLLEKAQNELAPYEVYYRFKRKDGEYLQIYDRGTFLTKNGTAYRMLGMMSDVTDVMESKIALLASEKRFKSLMNNLNVGVALYNEDLIPGIYNDAAYNLLGLTQDQFVQKAVIDEEWNVVDGSGEPMDYSKFPIPVAIASGMAVRDVVMGVFRPKLNDRVWLMVDAEPIYDTNHNFLHVICTYSNFSARKHMEEALEEKNRQLVITGEEMRRRNERLLEFAQIVSHNLRSPLSSISALAELLQDEENKNTRSQSVKFIREVCENALSTIDDLNEVLKVQQNERLESSRISFEEMFASVEEIMKLNLAEKNAHIEVDFESAPHIKYSARFLESILLSLLSNSIKFVDDHLIPHILIKTEKKGDDIILIFKDNGFGIDLSKYKGDVFSFGKTFHQNKEGKGMGLFMVKNQLRTMGDEIRVESELGKGTVFTITFRGQYNEK